MSERRFEEGDRVAWDHSQGTSRGEVVRVATEDGEIKSFHYSASKEDPRYIVESESTGAHAAHTADELRKA
ncbi:MAG TPA: DUF2945 domain-containing protein [Candidatus Thermoplasmatota archaeon]|nr:DUF2945 domain-containing protein [Candidatus Thermoplasmatota archaeon]